MAEHGRAGLRFYDRVLHLLTLEFIESLFGHPKGVHRRRHAAVKYHLGNDLADLFLGYPNMKSALDMPPD